MGATLINARRAVGNGYSSGSVKGKKAEGELFPALRPYLVVAGKHGEFSPYFVGGSD